MSGRLQLAAVVAAVTTALAAGLADARQAHIAVAVCATSSTEVWLGNGEGGGTAGRTYYPLEFSNVGHRTCTFYGYPGVSAWGANAKPLGPSAGRNNSAHGTVTLAPGATAHALLAIADWGAICSKAVNASGLSVYPPGQKRAQQIVFPFQTCAKQSVLVTGPLRAGVGIPGYTNS
jgi:hypothetical protein